MLHMFQERVAALNSYRVSGRTLFLGKHLIRGFSSPTPSLSGVVSNRGEKPIASTLPKMIAGRGPPFSMGIINNSVVGPESCGGGVENRSRFQGGGKRGKSSKTSGLLPTLTGSQGARWGAVITEGLSTGGVHKQRKYENRGQQKA